jgi:signal transduction histidine kinase
MLANMSHEVRTPLTSIIGFSEINRNQLEGLQATFADRVYQNAQRLMDTLNSVLHLSKLEANLETLDLTTVDLAHELQEVVEMLEPRAETSDVDLRLHVSESPLRMVSDRAALGSIAQNVIGNAIKFTEAGGRVDVRATMTGGEAIIEIEDTGIGIDPEFREDLFEAFTQESTGLQREHEGSGLGLALVDRLVRMLRGTITVESAKGEGTCFRVVLPVDPPTNDVNGAEANLPASEGSPDADVA